MLLTILKGSRIFQNVFEYSRKLRDDSRKGSMRLTHKMSALVNETECFTHRFSK